MKILANSLSYLFHPLLMATYGCLFVFFGFKHSIYDIFTPLKLKILITLTVFAFTCLLPVLNLMILHKLKFVQSMHINNRNERTLPFVMTSICYLGLFYVLYDFNIWPAIKLFILGAGLAILITAIINAWWKISAHMIGVGGLFGVLLALGYYIQIPIFIPISMCLLIAGMLGFARLTLEAHSQSQIYVGFLLGLFIQFGLFSLAHSFTFCSFQIMNLIIGATGLIGSHLALLLLQQNKDVFATKREGSDLSKVKKVFSYYVPNAEELFSKIKWVDADLNDVYSLIDAMADVKTVYHCAGLVSFDKKDRERLHKINTVGTANVVTACLDKKIQTLCYVSSIATLQNPDTTNQINETVFWKYSPRVSEYAISKYNAEREVYRGMEEGLNAVIVNPGVILGPGFWNQSSSKLIDSCYQGSLFYTMGTTGFIDVRDVANCMVQLVDKQKFNQRFILIENNYTFKDILSKIHQAFNKKEPSMETGKFLLKIAVWGDYVRSMVLQKDRRITKEIALSAIDTISFDNTLIKQTLNYQFIPVYDCIKFICPLYLKDKSQHA